LVFSIGFALTRSRGLLRRLLTEHAPDDARQQLAEQVVKHLEQSWTRTRVRCGSANRLNPTGWHGASSIGRWVVRALQFLNGRFAAGSWTSVEFGRGLAVPGF
jgi:hypothetical protein